MSRTVTTAGCAAILILAAWSAQVLPGLADDTQRGTGPADRGTKARSPEATPPRSRLRTDDVPLTHALLKQEEDTIEDRLAAALEKPTDIEWHELPLEDCLNQLSEYHGLPVVVDRTALSAAGIALDQPITLKLKGTRFESVLNLLLDPLDMEWAIQDEVLKFTTRDWCAEHPEVQAHEVQSLIDAGHTPEDLITAITTCIEPTSWSSNVGTDGYAGISHTGGVLVVRHTQRGQALVARLLADLDEIAERDAEDRPRKDRGAVVTVKVYSVGNQPAEKIAEALQELVEADSWKKRGGDGDVQPLEGKVIIRQTAAVHRAIQRLLTQLAPEPRPIRTAANTPTHSSGGGFMSNPSADPFGVLAGPSSAARGANPLRNSR